MKYLVGPNNRSNNLKDNTNLCIHICVHSGCNHTETCGTKTETCGNKTVCSSKCNIRGCYCLVSHDVINSTGSFI